MSNKKQVIFDYSKAENPFSGLGRFCIDLANALQNKLSSERFGLYSDKAKSVDLISSVELKKLEESTDLIFHATHQESKLFPKSSKTKFILTIHDLNFLFKYKDPFRRYWHLHKLQKKSSRADLLIFISEFTKEVFLDNCKVDPRQELRVIYNGNSLNIDAEQTEPDFIPEGKFVFSVGIISAKKNFHTLLPLLKYNPDLSLVIAGENTGDYTLNIMEMAAGMELGERIFLPGKISEPEKLWFYKNCEAFVFPSLAEGFGLPVIEAMSCSKPVFLLRSSSLPEVGGEHAYYWENTDPEEMNMTFKKGMIHYNSNSEIAENIRLHAATFSWEKSAIEYTEIYDSL